MILSSPTEYGQPAFMQENLAGVLSNDSLLIYLIVWTFELVELTNERTPSADDSTWLDI